MKQLMHRYWTLALCCALLLWSNTSAQQVPVEKYLPEGTEMAFTCNVKSLMESAAFVKHFKEDLDKRISDNSQLQNLMKSLDFDPRRDINSVTATFSKVAFGGPGQPPEGDFFIVVRGKFNPAKQNAGVGALLAAANLGERVKTGSYGPYTVYEAKMEGSSKTLYATIVDENTALFSSVKQNLEDAIERGLGKKQAANLPDKLKFVMGKVDTKQSFWGCMLIPNSVKEMSRLAPQPDVGDTMEKMDSQTFNLNLTDGAALALNMYFTDNDAAVKLKGMIEQAKELAGAFALSNERFGAELAALVESLKIDAAGKALTVKAEMKADALDKLVKMMKNQN